MARGINFLMDFDIDDNKIIDSTELSIVPYYDIEMQLGLRKRFDLGYLQIKAGVRDAMKRYGTVSLSAAAQINSHVALEIKAEKNAKADETLHLILGGKKDDIALQTTLQWFPSSQLTLSVEKSYFSSQDEIELGDGVRGRIDAQTTLYTAYPDFGGEIFCEFGVYDELKGKKGVIDIIDPEVDKVLPEDFWNIGATLYYGVDNSTRYARLWQPFFEFTSYYTDPTEQINIALNAGYGRSLSNGDTLTAGIDYVQAVNGTQDTTIELFLRYRWLY